MTDWSAPQRPAAHAERALVTAIIEGDFPAGSLLPSERELAARLGVTRPTLREALRRLESDGWLDVQQGKSTRVKDFWREGGLNVLSALVRYSHELPERFIENLLEVRLALAPAYTASAVARDPERVIACLNESEDLDDSPEKFASFDFRLHTHLTVASGNPIYTLILNGFVGFYEQMAVMYFNSQEARSASLAFYQDLAEAAQMHDMVGAEHITRAVMQESLRLWKMTQEV